MILVMCCFLSILTASQANTITSVIPSIVFTLQSLFEAVWNAIKAMITAKMTANGTDLHSIPYKEVLLCNACNLTFDFLIQLQRAHVPDQFLKIPLTALCSLFYSYSYCHGLIELNEPIFMEIAKRKPDLSSYHICGTIFEKLCAKKPVVEWSINIPEKKDYSKRMKTLTQMNYTDAYNVKETIEIAHVTDTHVDTKYKAGSVGSGCRELICCRDYQGQAVTLENAAGRWGNYNSCDIPWATLENTLATVRASHKKLKYIYMTGDLIAHNVFETSREENTKLIQEQAKSFYDTFGDVKLFPILGNHDPHPTNTLLPSEIDIPEFSGKWLYEVFYDSWFRHFPPETKRTFMRGGFYTVSPEPGFRIIGLNSLFGYVNNWWMILDPVDPGGQLAWLTEVLLEAERNKEKVHILMHSASAEVDVLQVWSREYNRIIDRFQDTVTAQFVGHTHRDQFYLFYNTDTTAMRPFSVAWNGGSVTTYDEANPNYKVYFVNKHTWEVEDIDTYTYNLTEANHNLNEPPKWFKLYSFKEAYDLPSLRLKDMDRLFKQLATDKNVSRKYFLNYLKNSDVAYKKECSSECRSQLLCNVVSPNNSTHCEKLLPNLKNDN